MSKNLRCFSPFGSKENGEENTPKKSPHPVDPQDVFFSNKKKHKTTTFFWMKCNFFENNRCSSMIPVYLCIFHYISTYFTSKKRKTCGRISPSLSKLPFTGSQRPFQTCSLRILSNLPTKTLPPSAPRFLFKGRLKLKTLVVFGLVSGFQFTPPPEMNECQLKRITISKGHVI